MSAINHSRRRFLKDACRHGVALVAGAWWSPLSSSERRFVSTLDRIRVGVIGCGVRGKYLIGNLPESAQVVALCDCATSRMADTLQPRGEFTGVLDRFSRTEAPHCATYQDYRRMLDEVRLDAVIIATPDHHHSLPACLALQAGLDVYLEKPMTLTIAEGRRIVELVERTGRILQIGSQQRTMEINRFACEFIRHGGLGTISHVELPNYPGPLSPPDFEEEPLVAGLDWDLFCGPAALRPHHRRLWVKDEFRVGDLLWRGWDLWRDYSGHLMTNWGAHTVDMVQLALGRDNTGPVEVRLLSDGAVAEPDERWQQATPLPESIGEPRFRPVLMRYADGIELRFIRGPDFTVFHGTRGMLRMRRNEFQVEPPDLISERPDPEVLQRWQGPGHVARPHLENWLECIRTRTTPHAPAEVGHRTATICHLANLVRELNCPLTWDPEQETFEADHEAVALLDRPRRPGFGWTSLQ